MIGELVVAATLSFSGFGILTATGPRLKPPVRALLSIPVGVAAYMSIAVIWGLVWARLDPGPALAVTGAIGVFGIIDALVRGHRDFWREGLLLLVAVTGIAAIARSVHLAAITPDSMRYILFSIQMVGEGGLPAVHAPDLLNRQIGYPSVHALSILTDRQYLASIGPLFGISTLGLFSWLLWNNLRPDRNRLIVVVVACAFLLSTNRFLYSWFYLNTHILVAAYLLIGTSGTWLAVKGRNQAWAWPVGISLGATILLRPESPLFAAVVLVVVAATPLGWRFRIPAVVPIILVATAWYGLILFPHPHYQGYMSLTSPVAGNMVAIGAAVGAVLLAGTTALRALARHLDTSLLVLMTLGFGFLAWRDLEVVGETAKSTVMNVEYGSWLFTWPVLTGLSIIALIRHRIPHGRLWIVPVCAFGLLYWILPLLRDGAWRVGGGDSGNRILIHMAAIVVGFVVLAYASTVEGEPAPREPAPNRYSALGLWYRTAVPISLLWAAAINVGLTQSAPHLGQPIFTHPSSSLGSLVHTDQAYIRRNYGFVFALREVAAGSVLVVRADNPISSRALRVFGSVTVERADFDASSLPEDVIPTSEPDGRFRPRGTDEYPYWILPGAPNETRWLAELSQGWVVVPESVAPVPEADR